MPFHLATLLLLTNDLNGSAPGASMQVASLEARPTIGTTDAGQPIFLGGLSGLVYLGADAERGVWRFVANTDRGPNCQSVNRQGAGKQRPFALPAFQPELVSIDVAMDGSSARIARRIGLTRPDGSALSGLPEVDAPNSSPARMDESACDLSGAALRGDPFGVDPEGLAREADGTFWLCEEYLPSLLHVAADGRMIERWVPAGGDVTAAAMRAVLPEAYGRRAINRGFEAVVLAGDSLIAFLQGPLLQEDAPKAPSRAIRVPVIERATAAMTAEHVYLLDDPSCKVADATTTADGVVLVLEVADRGAPGAKVYRVDFTDATDLRSLPPGAAGRDDVIEAMDHAALSERGIVPMSKTLVVDLCQLDPTLARKPEGIAVIDDQRLAIVNDDDFGLEGSFDPATRTLALHPSPLPTRIAVVRIPLGVLGGPLTR